MIKFRSVKETDFDELHRLSKLVLLINLPRDEAALEKQIKKSVKAFNDPTIKKNDGYYMFVAEDTDNGTIVGTSMIHGKHGIPSSPHSYFKIETEDRYSKTQKIGMKHTTLKLVSDTNGPTEIGGLVLDPQYRGHKERIGKSLSYIRFAYINLNRDRFENDLLAELLPPFDEDGRSALWEALGRKFTGLDYFEADIISRKNKEFIVNLFPKEKVYATLLSSDAREAIGTVGDSTKPVEKMLTEAGFKYMDHVDPFDGGPHFHCTVDELIPIKNSFKALVKFESHAQGEGYIVVSNEKDFEAFKIDGKLYNGQFVTRYHPDIKENQEYFFLPL